MAVSLKFSLNRNSYTFRKNIVEMDKAAAEGMSAKACAERILTAVLRGDKDLIICNVQARIAYYLHFLCPSLYFWIMENRASKLEKEE